MREVSSRFFSLSSERTAKAAARCRTLKWLRDDDAGFFAFEFGGLRELAAKEFDEAARARTAVGAQQTHPVEKNPQIEEFHILEGGCASTFGLLLLDFGNKGDQCGVEFARQRCVRRFFVDDPGAQCLESLSEGLDGGEDLGVCGRGLDGAELGDGEGQSGHELLMGVDDILRNFFVEQRSVRGQGALVLIFVAVCRDEIGAIGGAIDSDFALGAAANSADLFALSGAEAGRFALFTDGAGHGISSARQGSSAEYAVWQQMTKSCRSR